MFRLRPRAPGEPNLKHAFAERSLERAIQLGQYGVQFVPTPPDVELLKARVEDPATLRRMLDRLDFPGVVIVDTKGDLEALTRSALARRRSRDPAGLRLGQPRGGRQGARAPRARRRSATTAGASC